MGAQPFDDLADRPLFGFRKAGGFEAAKQGQLGAAIRARFDMSGQVLRHGAGLVDQHFQLLYRRTIISSLERRSQKLPFRGIV